MKSEIFIIKQEIVDGLSELLFVKSIRWKGIMLEEYLPFMWLIIIGNIENIIMSSQGASAHVNPYILLALNLIAVTIWLLIRTYGTKMPLNMQTT